MDNIKEILQELGYNLTLDTNGYRTNAVYRGGDNPTALKIFKDGRFMDYVNNHYGSLEELVDLTLGYHSLEQSRQWLKDRNFNNEEKHTKNQKPKITVPTIFPPEILNEFISDHAYYFNRGISFEILDELKGGVVLQGKMKNRYCFAIRDKDQNIIGLTGRSLEKNHKIRHKHLGSVKNFCFPIYNIHSYKEIGEKSEVILVEGLPDLLSLLTAGIRNCVCLFGLELHLAPLNAFLRLNVTKFIISVNSDTPGIEAAEKLKRKLSKYFDARNIRIVLPEGYKDWNEILIHQGIEEIRKQLNKI